MIGKPGKHRCRSIAIGAGGVQSHVRRVCRGTIVAIVGCVARCRSRSKSGYRTFPTRWEPRRQRRSIRRCQRSRTSTRSAHQDLHPRGAGDYQPAYPGRVQGDKNVAKSSELHAEPVKSCVRLAAQRTIQMSATPPEPRAIANGPVNTARYDSRSSARSTTRTEQTRSAPTPTV